MPLPHALWRERRVLWPCEHGGRPSRDAPHRGALPLPRDAVQRVCDVLMPSCDVLQPSSTLIFSFVEITQFGSHVTFTSSFLLDSGVQNETATLDAPPMI